MGAISTNASALIEKVGESGAYVSLENNSILLLVAAQAFHFIWALVRWIINNYFREQKDKDAEVKKLKIEFQILNTEVAAGFAELKAEMRSMGKMPSEVEIMNRLEQRMEFMVFKAARELGIKGPKA